ncbi:MAG: PDZ domain-containing protein, partial [Gemmatimonadota bacterium]
AVGRQERGWLGVTLRCSECVIRRGDTGRWDEYTFREPPEIAGVTRGSPADRADLRVGDVLTHVAGLALTTPDGARAFARLRPGDVVTLRYVREGRASTVRVEVEPEASADSLVAAAIREAYRGIVAAYGQARAAPGAPPEAEVSFSGTLGNVRIEIRGPVEVTKTDEGLVIRGGGMTVRLRETGRPGRNDR